MNILNDFPPSLGHATLAPPCSENCNATILCDKLGQVKHKKKIFTPEISADTENMRNTAQNKKLSNIPLSLNGRIRFFAGRPA
jgi:hypothetical protein